VNYKLSTEQTTSKRFYTETLTDIISESDTLGGISDGYHTFDELYDHRCLLWVILVLALKDTMSAKGKKLKAYKFTHLAGWFVLGIETRNGQISYHVPMKHWDKVKGIREYAPEFDGHKSKDVLERLATLIKEEENDLV
jgi:hypothetical protein